MIKEKPMECLPHKKPWIGRNASGFSMVEIIVAAVFISVAVLGTVKLVQNHVNLMRKSKFLTTAAATAEHLSAVIKAQPFDAIFSYDSARPNPYGGTPPLISAGGFDGNNYLIDLSTSPIRNVLTQLTNDVKAAGFDSWIMLVTYMRRDSTAMATSGMVQGVVPWAPAGSVTWTPLPPRLPDRY
jgi:Tfp pilus assembly protein PilV